MEANDTDVLLIFSADTALIDNISAILGQFDWDIVTASDRAALLARLQETEPAALLLDDAAPAAADALRAIRQSPVPLNGTPVLTIGKGEGSALGPGGRLTLPMGEAEFLQALCHWAGPLENRALRAAPWNFQYRLIRLLGHEAADTMLGNLLGMLEEAIAARDADAIAAHRLAGLAGMCGLTDLSRCWSRVDRGEDAALPRALAASRVVAAKLARRAR